MTYINIQTFIEVIRNNFALLPLLLKSDRLCTGTRCDNGLRLYNEPLDQSSQCLQEVSLGNLKVFC